MLHNIENADGLEAAVALLYEYYARIYMRVYKRRKQHAIAQTTYVYIKHGKLNFML